MFKPSWNKYGYYVYEYITKIKYLVICIRQKNFTLTQKWLFLKLNIKSYTAQDISRFKGWVPFFLCISINMRNKRRFATCFWWMVADSQTIWGELTCSCHMKSTWKGILLRLLELFFHFLILLETEAIHSNLLAIHINFMSWKLKKVRKSMKWKI